MEAHLSGTLTAFCDFETCPVSYDMVTWLVRAMLERDRRNCDRLHVVIVPNEQPDSLGGFSRHWGNHDEAATRWRLWHVCVACCPLARASVTVADSRRQAERMKADGEYWWESGKAHFMGPLVEAARRGETVPKLQATEAARRYVATWLDGRKVVTLTVRQQSTSPDRNSNLPAWEAFAEHAIKRGFHPLWVNESNVALANGQGYAELDPDIRMALYEQAAMNMIGANGPSVLMHCSGVPYLNFGVALNQGWRDHYLKYFGLKAGEQLPWATPLQRMIYRADDLAALTEEFDATL